MRSTFRRTRFRPELENLSRPLSRFWEKSVPRADARQATPLLGSDFMSLMIIAAAPPVISVAQPMH
jgi:hypothetical protein